ncbi:MAG: hypothetical protein MZV70_73010 [Desulfobacterales bacterium]|nr:hypothetical protein [Desulfobacterales bacterium]
MEIYNASFESLIQALETLDLEIIVLLFQTYIEVVHVRPTDEHISRSHRRRLREPRQQLLLPHRQRG